MSESNMRSVTTDHGTVTYKTVECCSCGNEVPADSTSSCVVGKLRDKHVYSHTHTFDFHPHKYTTGQVCEDCDTHNLVDLPYISLFHPSMRFLFIIGFLVGCLVGLLVTTGVMLA